MNNITNQIENYTYINVPTIESFRIDCGKNINHL